MSAKNVQVVILAAGCSRRLAPLTQKEPKSFLRVGGKRLIDYHLENLDRAGFSDVCLVVGYRAPLVQKTLGNRFGNLRLHYVASPDYATTGHGYSWYLTRPLWEESKRPLYLVHADVFVDPQLLERLIAVPEENVITVDNHYTIHTQDEILVHGQNGIITGMTRVGTRDERDVVGELIGYSKFSPEFMEKFYTYMETFLQKQGAQFNYEPVLDLFIQETGIKIHYLTSDGLKWMNINYEADLRHANEQLFPHIKEALTT